MILILDLALVDMAHCIFEMVFQKSMPMAYGHTYPFPWPMATQSVSMA
jgi:hypothetical protein